MALDWLKKSRITSFAGLGRGRDGRAAVVDQDRTRPSGNGNGNGRSRGPTRGSTTDIIELIKEGRWRGEWTEHRLRWQFLLDSQEGGQRYRESFYGWDRFGFPVRNLQRHKRETPDPQRFPGYYSQFMGSGASPILSSVMASGMPGLGQLPGQLGADPLATYQDDDYEMRRAATPVPGFLGECIEIHLSKIYDQEVHREGPPDLVDWWLDVDGRGTPIDTWMKEIFAPLQLAIGFLDVAFDHPEVPPGEQVLTRADELRLGLDRCIVSYILPENMVWWRLVKGTTDYSECLVKEYVDPADRNDYDKDGKPINPEPLKDNDESSNWRRNYIRYRHWTPEGSQLYNYSGEPLGRFMPHPFGHVPIRRIISKVRHRSPHIGLSRYEEIAELQRAFYNRDSEEILTCTLHAHPILSGPEDFCKSDNSISFGPGYVLPKKKNPETGAYEGWEFITPASEPAESLRKAKQALVDRMERVACLAKPAGAAGGASTVSQSGISKEIDSRTGHKHLMSLAQSMATAERLIAEYSCMVMHNAPLEPEERIAIVVNYPTKFELSGASELIDDLTKLQLTMQNSGTSPKVELAIFEDIIRQRILGRTDQEYEELDAELEAMVLAKSTLKEANASLHAAVISSKTEAMEGGGDENSEADPTGISSATSVGGGFYGSVSG